MTTQCERIALIVLGVVAGSCGNGDDPNGEKPERPVKSAPAFVVRRATELEVLEQPPLILARDGGYSGIIEGRAAWLYGDTVFSTQSSGQVAMVSNSWAWTDDLDASDGLVFSFPLTDAGTPSPFFSHTEAELDFNAAHEPADCREEPCGARWALWPQVMVSDPSQSGALVFYGKVYVEPGMLNFVTVGRSIAVWNQFSSAPNRHDSHPEDEEPVLIFREGEPGFGTAAVVEGDLLYVYGCNSNDASSDAKPCCLGRVPFDRALDRTAWSYYTGESWSPELDAAVPVMDGNDVMSVGYNPYLGVYIAVYAKPLENAVLVRSAPRPEGPWSEPVKAFDAQTPATLWVYDALAHPEYQRDEGRIQYVTYSMATGEGTSLSRLVELELAQVQTD